MPSNQRVGTDVGANYSAAKPKRGGVEETLRAKEKNLQRTRTRGVVGATEGSLNGIGGGESRNWRQKRQDVAVINAKNAKCEKGLI